MFVWTFDHGGYEDLNQSGFWDPGEEVFLCLMDENFQNQTYDFIMASDFSNQLNQIAFHKRAIWMQQCHSGGFIEFLEDTNSIIITACHASTGAYPADNLDIYGNHIVEWEPIEWNGELHYYQHGEFNLHVMASIVGEYPNGDPAIADNNGDNLISSYETKLFNEENRLRMIFFQIVKIAKEVNF